MERIEKAIDINVPVKVAYAQCLRFSDYPRFMEGMQEVRLVDERHLHWCAGQPDRITEWGSVITEREPEKSLAWRDRDGPRQTVTLSFIALGNDKARIKIVVEQAEHLPSNGETPGLFASDQLISGNLERLKKLLENEGHDWNQWPSTHHAESSASAQAISLDGAPPAEKMTARSTSGGQAGTSRDAERKSSASSSPLEGLQSVQGLLQKWDQPLSMVRKMSGEMDQLFERLVGRPLPNKWGYGMSGKWVPAVEVAQRGQEFVVSVDLPGVEKQDVHLEISDGTLNLEGERREPGEQKSLPGYRRSERHYGRFYRQIPLPEGIAADQVRATMVNGVLEVRMPLPPGMGRQGRRVDIEDRS